jgi:hypothetical protein
VELVYLAPGLGNLPSEMALDPAYHLLVPAWSFTGHITNAGSADLIFRAYVQATDNP